MSSSWSPSTAGWTSHGNSTGNPTTPIISVTESIRKIKYVIITGCSTGIGYETAKYLKEKKFKVIVSCRKIKDVKRLSKEFDYAIQLDTSSSNSIKKAFILIKKIVKNDLVYGIFCNAGYGQYGAVEDLTRELIMD